MAKRYILYILWKMQFQYVSYSCSSIVNICVSQHIDIMYTCTYAHRYNIRWKLVLITFRENGNFLRIGIRYSWINFQKWEAMNSVKLTYVITVSLVFIPFISLFLICSFSLLIFSNSAGFTIMCVYCPVVLARCEEQMWEAGWGLGEWGTKADWDNEGGSI